MARALLHFVLLLAALLSHSYFSCIDCRIFPILLFSRGLFYLFYFIFLVSSEKKQGLNWISFGPMQVWMLLLGPGILNLPTSSVPLHELHALVSPGPWGSRKFVLFWASRATSFHWLVIYQLSNMKNFASLGHALPEATCLLYQFIGGWGEVTPLWITLSGVLQGHICFVGVSHPPLYALSTCNVLWRRDRFL